MYLVRFGTRHSASSLHRLLLLCLSVALCVSTSAIADNPQIAKTNQRIGKQSPKARFREPDGFLGLKFGVPLTRQLQACDHRVYGEQSTPPVFCYAKLSTGALGYAELENPPQIGLAYSAVVLLLDSSVEDICLSFRSEDFPQMLKLLSVRFGKPKVTESTISEGKAGDMYEGKVHKWFGPSVSITLSEYGDKPDESKLVLATNRYLRALQQ